MLSHLFQTIDDVCTVTMTGLHHATKALVIKLIHVQSCHSHLTRFLKCKISAEALINKPPLMIMKAKVYLKIFSTRDYSADKFHSVVISKNEETQ